MSGSGSSAGDERFIPASAVVSRSVGDETVLVNLDSERYFSLNRTGAVIWGQLSAGGSRADALAQVLSEFEIDQTTANQDLGELVSALVSAGLLEPAP
jgi:Coenzyme PQQ synthesis protein D (PqqD)